MSRPSEVRGRPRQSDRSDSRFSKIEAGRLELVQQPFDLRRLVEGIAELLALSAQMKGLEIAASIAASTPRFVVGDSLRLRQGLTNLAGNAVKFTDCGGIGLAVEADERGRLLFKVMDTGPGVPSDRPPRSSRISNKATARMRAISREPASGSPFPGVSSR